MQGGGQRGYRVWCRRRCGRARSTHVAVHVEHMWLCTQHTEGSGPKDLVHAVKLVAEGAARRGRPGRLAVPRERVELAAATRVRAPLRLLRERGAGQRRRCRRTRAAIQGTRVSCEDVVQAYTCRNTREKGLATTGC